MKRLHRQLLIGILMSATGLAAMAQSNPSAAPAGAAPNPPKAMAAHMDRGDQANFKQRMAERQAKRLASLKTKLKLSADQETAWATFSSAMQAPAERHNGMRHGELEKLSTPERIDQMNRQMAQRQDMMRQRGEATKSFYATLNAEQQKIFDQATPRHGRRESHHRG